MIRRLWAVAALWVVTGCASGITGTTSQASSPETFVGTWRSVTPPFEFIGLSVNSTSSEMGGLYMQLTFSGVAWEGRGRVDVDSMVAGMFFAGTAASSGVIVARAPNAQTLHVQVRPAAAAAFDLTFVREH